MGEGVSMTKGVSHIGEKKPPENKLKEHLVAAAQTIPTLPYRKGGIFEHPNDWTDEENEVIAAGLRAMLPLWAIGEKVHCERHALAKHIEDHPALRQLRIDCRESFIDAAEYQAYRLIQAGNPTMTMFALERQGKKRGWGQQDEAQGQKEESRIVMGLIPEDEVKGAEETIAGLRADGTIPESEVDAELAAATDPMAAAIAAQAAADSVLGQVEQAETSQTPPEVEATHVSQPPYAEEGDVVPQTFDDGGYDDPEMAFAGGEDSPFNL